MKHLDRVAALGCIVCAQEGTESPAAIHHIRAGQGLSQRSSDYLTIPLCPAHHQHGGPGVAFHAAPRQFEAMYGTELELLAETIRRLHERNV